MPQVSPLYGRGKLTDSSLGGYNICCPIVESSVEPQTRPAHGDFSRPATTIRRSGRHRAPPGHGRAPVPAHTKCNETGVGAYRRTKDLSRAFA